MSFEPDLSRIILRRVDARRPDGHPRLAVHYPPTVPSKESGTVAAEANLKHREMHAVWISGTRVEAEEESSAVRSSIDLKKCLKDYVNVNDEESAMRFVRTYGPLGISEGIRPGLRDPLTEELLINVSVYESVSDIVSLAVRIKCFMQIGRDFHPSRPRKLRLPRRIALNLKDLTPSGTSYSFEEDDYVDFDATCGDRRNLGSIDAFRYVLVADAIGRELTDLLKVRFDLYKSPIIEPVSLYGALLLYVYQTCFLNQERGGRYKKCAVCDTTIWETSKAAGRRLYCSDACRKLVRCGNRKDPVAFEHSLKLARVRRGELHLAEAPATQEINDLINDQLKSFGAEATLAKLRRIFETQSVS